MGSKCQITPELNNSYRMHNPADPEESDRGTAYMVYGKNRQGVFDMEPCHVTISDSPREERERGET